MNKPHLSVPQLLEQYVFTVAAQFIEQLDKPEQDQLIQFIVKLDPGAVDQTSLCVDQPTEPGLFVSAEIGETVCREQRGGSNSRTERFNQEDKYPYSVDRLIASQQTHIDSTIINIAGIAVLIDRTRNMPMSDPARKNRLLSRYESFRENYMTYLAKMQGFQQEQRHRLARSQKQLA